MNVYIKKKSVLQTNKYNRSHLVFSEIQTPPDRLSKTDAASAVFNFLKDFMFRVLVETMPPHAETGKAQFLQSLRQTL